MTPLEAIKNWIEGLPTNMQMDVIFLSCHFHPDENIMNADHFDRARLFLEYLDVPKEEYRKIITRTLIISRLIDHALSGRDSEADWTASLDRSLDIINQAQSEEERTEDIKTLLHGFTEKKEQWLQLSADWNLLKESHFTDTLLTQYYFSEWGNHKKF